MSENVSDARAAFDAAVAANATHKSVEALRASYATQLRLMDQAEASYQRAQKSLRNARRRRDDRAKVLASVALELKIAAEAAGVDPLGDPGGDAAAGAVEGAGAPDVPGNGW